MSVCPSPLVRNASCLLFFLCSRLASYWTSTLLFCDSTRTYISERDMQCTYNKQVPSRTARFFFFLVTPLFAVPIPFSSSNHGIHHGE
ncbi:hypothetical protein M431DRAFT_504228 [Trichoderma harzianum CBS 226.95]|uniref:Secreted protein n=1 Tax=Trichoderma harzianum CBS 226.95 TaxID=983964 RepID=A0A2T4AQG7_TRIHA|nr:hypothetical protein M431DRAFT_504228 [Trichoderma harzianum CBS 226.95]PTB59311.1 hypothetical protein M431DRAFT_504228 [Trichoderma harzianum CBS 226.95]